MQWKEGHVQLKGLLGHGTYSCIPFQTNLNGKTKYNK
jgi:hypothetical protein